MNPQDGTFILSLLTASVQWLETNWIVPAGLIALFFYGRYHFDTPDYALELTDKAGKPLPQAGRLISLAPPKFTTSRTRFDRYALRYVLLLWAAFLVIIFVPTLVTDIGRILKMEFPSAPASETLQFRALFALFALTGLLSSFPGLKDIDAWVLKKLHEAALIPEEVKYLARKLYDASFTPSQETAGSVRQMLRRRDTLRGAEGQASGALEQELLRALWLKTQLLEVIAGDVKYIPFKTRLERDLDDIASASETLRYDLLAYFHAQEELVPADAKNIDDWIQDNLKKPQVT